MSNDEECSDAGRSRVLGGEYYPDSARRLTPVRGFFNRSAKYYDGVNRIFSLGSGVWYRRRCLRRSGVRPGACVIDVAAGTGLLTGEALALTDGQGMVVGIDISEEMLAVAQRSLGIPLIQAAAEALPLVANIADFVTMGYAIRHVADLKLALSEALRVLRPGGSAVLLEISTPRNRLVRAFAAVFIGLVLPAFALLLTRDRRSSTLMRYHWETIVTSMPPDVVMAAMRQSGFCDVNCTTHFDLFHHYIGRKPGDEK